MKLKLMLKAFPKTILHKLQTYKYLFFEGFGDEQIQNRITTIIETDVLSFLEELMNDSEKYFKNLKRKSGCLAIFVILPLTDIVKYLE